LDVSIELDELRDAAKRVLEKHVDRLEIIKNPAAVPGLNRALWKTIAELGWPGLGVPEERGGLGQPFTALAALYRELGRSLSGSAFSSAAIGLDLLSQDDANAASLPVLEAAVAGDAIVVAAQTGTAGLATSPRGANVLLDGTIQGVLGAGDATHLLVPFEIGEPTVALVALPNPQVTITPRATWDITRGEVFELRFDALEIVPESAVLRGAAAGMALARAAAHFDLALACDAVGGAEQIFSETLAYMDTRKQFNRVIASFQALKHRCADLKTAMEASRALVDASCAAFSAGQGEWRAMAAASRLYAGAVYRQVSEEAVQLHGGIGFTWEHPCHLFLKRARLNDVLGGTIEARKDAAASVMLRAAHQHAGSLLGHQLEPH
jgi:alkylation response protein AidB-like acyl-CoA dehydrogenase